MVVSSLDTTPSKSVPVPPPLCRLNSIIIAAKNANKAASKYMTAVIVIKIAQFCFCHSPKAPKSEADPKIIRHTKAQDMARFCIPERDINYHIRLKPTDRVLILT